MLHKWNFSSKRNKIIATGIAIAVSLLAVSYVSSLASTSPSVVDYGSYTIFVNSTATYAKNMATGNIDYQSSDSATVFNNVFSALSNGGLVFVKAGNYNINSPISASAKGIQLVGEGFDNTQSSSVTATRLRLTGTSSIDLKGAHSLINNVFIDGGAATGPEVLIMSGTQDRIGSVYVWGHSGGNAVKINGTSGGYISNIKVDHLLIQSGGGSSSTAGLYLQYVTQSEFSDVLSTGANVTGVILDNSDNNHFTRLHITSMVSATSGQMLMLGTNSASGTYGDVFDYVAMTPDATHTGIVVNHPLNITNGENPSRILQYDNEGTYNMQTNNNAYGAVVIDGIQKRLTDFTISTPALPGTSSSSAVQNTFLFTVQIYQTGGVGLHIITLSGTDTAVYDTNYLTLHPGEKVYWSTTKPTAWKWQGT